MSRKLTSVSAVLAFTVLVLVASSAIAQVDRVRPYPDDAIAKVPTLGCCKCLGGTNNLDLSTIASNSWTVTNNGNTIPAVFLSALQINAAWNINPGPARWVSTSVGSGNGSPGNFDYNLSFVVPECTIRQAVTLAGNFGADNNIALYLDSITSANLIATCTGNYCFTSTHQPLPTFTKTVGYGPHTLIARVNNANGPSGMFVNAKLTGTCAN
jgi:hypothetical protein